MSQHTPGPWKVGTSGITIILGGEPGTRLASFSVEREADARLIAAAPEMRDFIYMVAFETIGKPDATHKKVLDTITTAARALLARIERTS